MANELANGVYNIDLSDDGAVVVQAMQYDKNSRKCVFYISNKGEVITLSKDVYTVRIKYKNGNVPAYHDLIINPDGSATFVISDDMTQIAGDGNAQLVINDAVSGRCINSRQFIIKVGESVFPNDEIVTTEQFDAITNLILRADTAVVGVTNKIEACDTATTNSITATNNCIEKTTLCETATTNANASKVACDTATTNANTATADCVEKTTTSLNQTGLCKTVTDTALLEIDKMKNCIKKTEVVNNTVATDTDLPVSAAMATSLKQQIDTLSANVSGIANNQMPEAYIESSVTTYINNNQSNLATKDLLNTSVNSRISVSDLLNPENNKVAYTELELERGTIDTGGQDIANENSSKNFRSVSFIQVNNFIKISISDGFLFSVIATSTFDGSVGRFLNSNGERVADITFFNELNLTNYDASHCDEIRICIKKSDDSVMSDIDFYQCKLTAQKNHVIDEELIRILNSSYSEPIQLTKSLDYSGYDSIGSVTTYSSSTGINFKNSSMVDISGYLYLILNTMKYSGLTTFGCLFTDENNNVLETYSIEKSTSGISKNVTKILKVPDNAKWFGMTHLVSETLSDWSLNGIKKEINLSKRDNTILVCAADSDSTIKKYADYICTGKNDEVTIQNALDKITNETLMLASGNYYIDSFPNQTGYIYSAIMAKKTRNHREILIRGANRTKIPYSSLENIFVDGAIIHVSDTCYNSLDVNTQYSIFDCESSSGNRYYPFAHLRLEDVSIVIPDNQRKIICINGYYFSSMSISGIHITAVKDVNNIHNSVAGMIGVVGLQGSNYGVGNIWKSSFVWGCYEGYAVSGEHLIGMDLGARFCDYGYTFNNYTNTTGAWMHPITLINVCDECNFNMPKFGNNGESGKTDGLSGRQSINLIDYNMEWLPQYYALGGEHAKEINQGFTFGEIRYTIQPSYGGDSKNSVSIPFWTEGHGKNVKTINEAHQQAGSSNERMTYAANYIQQYFDMTLNKLVLYDGTKWIDVNGNIV